MIKSDSFESLSQNLENRVRFHEVYCGSSQSCCQGRLIMGYSYYPLTLTFVLLNGGLCLYYFRILPFCVFNFALIVVTCVLHALTLIFMLFTSFADPGIIPKQHSNMSNKYEELFLIPYETTVVKQKFNNICLGINEAFQLRFCECCHIHKLPRTAHCGRCDNCIQDFDHHCKWLGTCIGRRNYAYFFSFIFLLTGLLIVILIQIISALLSSSQKSMLIELSIYIIIVIVFSLFTSSLLIFHIYLIQNNLTTLEYLLTEQYIRKDRADYMQVGQSLRRRFEQLCFSIKQRILHQIHPSFIKMSDYVYRDEPMEIKRINMQLKNKQDKSFQARLGSQLINSLVELSVTTNQLQGTSQKSKNFNHGFSAVKIHIDEVDNQKISQRCDLGAWPHMQKDQSVIKEEASFMENGSKYLDKQLEPDLKRQNKIRPKKEICLEYPDEHISDKGYLSQLSSNKTQYQNNYMYDEPNKLLQQ